jgi:hypothetical protein
MTSEVKRGIIYVSSPLGFSYFGRLGLTALLGQLDGAGFTVNDPWRWPDRARVGRSIRTADLLSSAIAAGERGWDVSHEIAARNVTLLRAADAVLAVLDGSDVDSGVAAEVGYASAIGRPVVGLRTDERASVDGPGYPVNLQVTHLIANSSPHGFIAGSIEEALDGLRTAIGGQHE